MTQLTLGEAKDRLPEVLQKGAKGEEIVINGDGFKYRVKVTIEETKKHTQRIAGLGGGKAVLTMSDDFDEEDPEINAMFYGE